jgi:hypothetical protein
MADENPYRRGRADTRVLPSTNTVTTSTVPDTENRNGNASPDDRANAIRRCMNRATATDGRS